MSATCQPGQHRCGALALWMFDQPLALAMAADCEARLPTHYWRIRTTLPHHDEALALKRQAVVRGRLQGEAA